MAETKNINININTSAGSKYEKPPLGVSPHWFVNRERIKELNEAISRYLEYIEMHQHTIDLKANYEVIAEWAKEIEYLAMFEVEIRSNDND